MKYVAIAALVVLVLVLLFFGGVNKDSRNMPDRDDP